MTASEGLLRWCFTLTVVGLMIQSISAAPDFSSKVSSGEEVLVITTDATFNDATEVTTSQGNAESWEINTNDVDLDKARKSENVSPSAPDMSKLMKPEIYSFRIQSDIKYRYSRTHVTSRVVNRDLTRAQEVTFRVVLPETAFISKFIMEIDGKAYEAYVKEKEEAKRVYTEAQSQGQTAGLVELSTRNSNIFNVNVNIKPQAKVTFNLTYEELLSRRLGRYEQSINISPDQVSSVKDFQIVVNIDESQNITYLRVPNLRKDVGENENNADNPDAVINRPAGNRANITWSPSIKDQEGLSKDGINGKFVVQYDVSRESNSGEVLVMEGYFVHFFAPEKLQPLRKHVVFILDISGSMWGRKMEQLKDSQKKILDDLSSDDFFNIITFSSDVFLWSPNDPLTTVSTSSWYAPFRGENSPKPLIQDGLKRQPFPASKENILKAKEFIDSLQANGGTNIHDSIITAINLTSAIKDERDGIVKKKNEEDPTVYYEPLPTALPMVEDATTTSLPETATSPPSSSSVMSRKSDKIILPKNVESLIIFLTDGEPTVGITDPPHIQKLIQAANRNITIPIFSLGFGEGADFPFLKKLSLQNYGFARKIYEASDAALQLKGFYNEIASPLLSNVVFNYTSSEYNVTDITITKFPTIFGGTEIAIAGKITGYSDSEFESETEPTTETTTGGSVVGDFEGPTNKNAYKDLVVADERYLDISIAGTGREGIIDFDAPVIFCRPIGWGIPNLTPFPPRPTPPPTQEDQFLERLWAYLTIQQLIDQDLKEGDTISNEIPDNDFDLPPPYNTEKHPKVLPVLSLPLQNSSVLDRNATLIKETPKQHAIRLALKYGFVTPFTSLVVVKPNSSDITNTVSSDARPESLDSMSAPQSMISYFAIAKPPLAFTKFNAVSNHLGGPQSLAYQSFALQPLSLAQPNSISNRIQAGSPSGFPGYHSTPHTPTSVGPFYLRVPQHHIRPSSVQSATVYMPTKVYQSVDFVSDSEDVQVAQEGLSSSFSNEEESTTAKPLTIEDIQWFNKNNLVLRINGTEYTIDLNQTTEVGGDCAVGNTGKMGQCTHLKDCVQQAFIGDMGLFTDSYFCSIANPSQPSVQYVGACCPKQGRSFDEDP